MKMYSFVIGLYSFVIGRAAGVREPTQACILPALAASATSAA